MSGTTIIANFFYVFENRLLHENLILQQANKKGTDQTANHRSQTAHLSVEIIIDTFFGQNFCTTATTSEQAGLTHTWSQTHSNELLENLI